jgi:hypothetical protein
VLTQVISGVSKGEVVSLADLNAPLPTSSANTTRAGFGAGSLGGGSPGGGGGLSGRFGGGGFGG